MKRKRKAQKARKHRSNPSKRPSTRSTRRSARVRAMRANPSFFSAARSRPKKKRKGHRARRRRRNPEMGTIGKLLVAAGVAGLGLAGLYYLNSTMIPPTWSPRLQAVVSGTGALAGAYLLYQVSPPAALGLAAGVGGVSAFTFAQTLWAEQANPGANVITPGTQPAALGALERIGALENVARAIHALEPINGLTQIDSPIAPVSLRSRLNGLEDDMTIYD